MSFRRIAASALLGTAIAIPGSFAVAGAAEAPAAADTTATAAADTNATATADAKPSAEAANPSAEAAKPSAAKPKPTSSPDEDQSSAFSSEIKPDTINSFFGTAVDLTKSILGLVGQLA